MIGPYAAAAWLYRKAGWQGVIPVGRGPAQKSPPPAGYTGWAGIDPSGADVQTWIDGREADWNIGLHIPAGVVVIDVDAYHGGAETLATLGTLPSTYTNTARGRHARSRHHFFRAVLAEGRVWRDHPGGNDGGIDVLHVGHRYAVVWPSVNPQADGATYTWYGPDGEPCEIPFVDELPELPPEWVERLSTDGVPLDGSAAGDAETLDVVHRYRPGPPCPRVVRLLHSELDRIGEALQGRGGLHMPGPLYSLVSYGIEGHAGVGAALSHHQAVYTAARVSSRNESQGFADAEWWRQVRGAVGKKLTATGGAIEQSCACGDGRRGGGEGLPIPGVAPDDMAALRAELAAIADPVARVARARQAAAGLAALADAELLPWRDMLKEIAGLTFGDFMTIVRAERVAAAAELDRQRRDELTTAVTQQGGGELPSRVAPLPVARALADRFAGAGRPVLRWRGDWYVHHGAHWQMVDESAVRSMVYLETERAFYTDPEDGPKPWNPDTASVSKVLDSFAHGPGYRPATADVARCVAAVNGVLDPLTRALYPHTPERFNTWSLPYAYDPYAACPQWLAFLDQVMPDPENRRLLQQWFGYMVSGRTDLQKILSLFGAPRSGKGTVLRVLVGLVGAENRTTVTLTKLTQTFGRESMIGKTLAQITDANWNIREVGSAVEALLTISGEDDQGIDRKNREAWEGRLSTRFVIVGNPMPRFNDPSGALLARMLHIEFTRSFAGAEDETLTPRLLAELPGILNWALDGLADLTAAGRLVVPAASREAGDEIERTTSPVAGFLRDCTEYVDPSACVALYLDELYQAFRGYASGPGGVEHLPTRDVFARDLRAAGHGRVVVRREGSRGARVQRVYGLHLTTALAPPLSR